ncbi:MAG: response regulator [Deltaproteobacteria bacterium]|nr:response regulator [Deltaproteobacteria bacterium]
MTERKAFSTQQAAALCGVDRRSMLRWVKAGVLPSYQTGGGRWRIQPDDLVAFMRDRGMAVPAELAPSWPTVVIVDDDEGFVNALRRVVSARRPDARVLTAMDGFTGGMLVAAERPDLLLLDVQMEGLDGVEVCRRIRADASLGSISIVILSGHLNEELEAELRGLGVLHCLRKPVPPAQIHGLLDKHLQVARPAANGA